MADKDQRAANKERRKLALMADEKTYYPTTPCKRGHFSPRYSADASCVQCKKERNLR